MTAYALNFNGPKCFIGDFNAITASNEKFGGLPVLNSNIAYFNDFIQENHLIDLGFKGPAYTWTNGRDMDNLIRQRLDRVLANPEWCIGFHNAAVLHLPRLASDHAPILLNTCRNIQRAPPNYKFEAHWLSHPEFMEKVNECWSQDENEDIQSKLRKLGSFLTEWSRRRIDCIKHKIVILKAKLLRIQSWRPSTSTIQKEKLVLAQLNDFLIMEATYWDQRMKQQWAKCGDRNTRHFHLSVQQRRRKNNITHLLKEDNTWTSDQGEISRVLINHFKSLFQENAVPNPPQFNLQSMSTSNVDNEELCRIPSMEEIWSVISKMGSFTSPGPDGYSPIFYKKCWSTVCNDVFNQIKEIFTYTVFPELLNHTNITLIPKMKNPASPSDYRPISLCNVLYKIVAKILSNRMKPYLEEFISWSQSAFVPGRQILDNIIIAKELLHSMHNSRAENGNFALKVDMVKAYDRVNWNFLRDMLQIMGITDKAHSLIMACVMSASFSININGSTQGFFKNERGIRQGCPLSPTLFIICSQGLSMLIQQAESQGLYQGYKLNCQAPTITHLMFADDLFFFGKHSRVNVLNLKRILQQYAALSGQLTNYNKSSICFSKGISDIRKQTTIQDLGVKEMVEDDKYLGIYPLKSDYRKASFDFLTDKVSSRLPGWRFHFTNMAERTVILKTALASIPIYFMGICLLPKGTTQEIDRIQRCFWWGHSTDERKLHFINWGKVFLRKEEGGLGVKHTELMNMALICKLAWRFLENEEAVLVKLMASKYLQEQSYWTATKPEKCSAVWSSLLKVREHLENKVFWQVSNGEKVNIWDNPWVHQSIEHIIRKPDSMAINLTKVSELLLPNSRVWNMDLLNQIFPSETVACINAIYLSEDDSTVDKIIWSCTPNGKFSTKSCYRLLQNNLPSSSLAGNFPWKKLWAFSHLQPKILIFIWKILHNGIAVKMNVHRFISGIETVCALCGQQNETAFHLFFDCVNAKMVFEAADVQIANMSNDWSIAQIIQEWMENNLDQSFIKCACILWNIWKARNDIVFSNGTFSIKNIIKKAKRDFEVCMDGYNTNAENETATTQNMSWYPPVQPFVKINVDAAFIPNNGAAGAIARDYKEKFMGCATSTFIASSALLAEAVACRLGLEMGIELNFTNVIIEGDAANITAAINGDVSDIPWSIRSEVLKIKDLSSFFTCIQFQHVRKNANSIAHDLCQYAFKFNVNRMWYATNPPQCISSKLCL